MSRIGIIGDNSPVCKQTIRHLIPLEPVAIKCMYSRDTKSSVVNSFSGEVFEKLFYETTDSKGLEKIFTQCDTVLIDLKTLQTQTLSIIIEGLMASKIRSVVVICWEDCDEICEEITRVNKLRHMVQESGLPVVYMYQCFFWEQLGQYLEKSEDQLTTQVVGDKLKIDRCTGTDAVYTWSNLPLYPPLEYGISISDFGQCIAKTLISPIKYLSMHIKPCGEYISLRNISVLIESHQDITIEKASLLRTTEVPNYKRYKEHATVTNPETALFYTWLKKEGDFLKQQA